nr:hypothetical protein [Tanacetum cinerariifolium]
MAYAIICLAKNQKFNFSKYIFESTVKHLDIGKRFLMYPRFVQVFLDKQVDGMSKHNAIYVIPSHIKKVVGNMKRVGKDFSRKETPLFPIMLVSSQKELGEGSTMPSAPHHLHTIIQPSTSKPEKKHKPRKSKNMDTWETQPKTTKTAQAKEISSLKRRVKRLEKKKKRPGTHGLKRLYKGRNIADIDADVKINLVDENAEDQGRFDNQEMFDTSVLDDEEEVILKESQDVQNIEDENLAWDNVQAMMDADYELAAWLHKEEQGELTIEEKSRLFEFNKTMRWINSFVPMDSKVVKDKALLTQESSSKRVGDELDQERSKKQKVEDDKESKELKRCLEIIPDDGDDVTIDATPLSIK